jgi:adenine deaminase
VVVAQDQRVGRVHPPPVRDGELVLDTDGVQAHAERVVVRDGTLIDGTGAPARRADVAVSAGRITAIGEDLGPAARTIDATAPS